MSFWDLYRVTECQDVRWAELVQPAGRTDRFLAERLTSEALLRADLVIKRLGHDEAEVFRSEASNGMPLDIVVFATHDETIILVGAARPHSSGLNRLAFVYSALARSRDAVVFTDATGAILGASACWRDLYGYPVGEVLGRNPRLVNSRRHSRAFFRRLWLDLTDRGIGSWSGELENRKRNGDRLTVWQTITTFRDTSGFVAGYLGVTRDMTAHRELVARLARMEDALARHSQLSRFGSEAQSLQSSSDELVEQVSRALEQVSKRELPELHDRLTTVQTVARDLRSLVVDGSSTSQQHVDEQGLERSRVFLRSLVRTEVEVHSVLAARRGVEVLLHPDGASFPCFVDENLMAHAVSEVLRSAVDRTPSGRAVNVLVQADPECGRHEILIDRAPLEGHGEDQAIDREEMDDDVELLEASLDAVRGMAVAREIVERHAGSIEVEMSEDGEPWVAIRLPIETEWFLERLWAVVVYDPPERLWPVVSLWLRATGIPGFVAQGEEELREIFAHELPNVVLHPPEHPIAEACQAYPAPGGTGRLEPVICGLQSLAKGEGFQIETISGPQELAVQVEELLRAASPMLSSRQA